MKSILKNKSMQKLQKMCSAKNMIVFLKYALIIILSFVSLNYLMNYLSPEQDYYQGPGSLIEASSRFKKKHDKQHIGHDKLHKKLTALMNDVNDGKYVTSLELEKAIDDAMEDAKSDGMSQEDIKNLFSIMKSENVFGGSGSSGPSEQEIDQMIQSKINQYAANVADEFDRLKTPEIETTSRGNDFRTPAWEGSAKHIHNPIVNKLAMETPGRRILQDDAYDKALSMGGGDENLRQRMKNDRFSFLNPSSSGYESTLSRFFTALLPISRGSDSANKTKAASENAQKRNFLAAIQGGMGLKPSSYLGGDPNAPKDYNTKRASPTRYDGVSVNPANRSIQHARKAIDTERKYLMHLGAMKALQAHEAAHINAKKYNFYPYGPNTLGNYNKAHTDQKSERLAETSAVLGIPRKNNASSEQIKTAARNYGFGVLAPPGTDKRKGPHQVKYALSQSQFGDPYYLSKM